MKVFVSGGAKYADVKQLQRALNALHEKRHIETLITGERGGAEEMAYFWAVSRRVREIIVVPTQMEALTRRFNRQRRNLDVLEKYRPDAVVVFSYPGVDPLVEVASRYGFKVWDVPTTFR